MARRRGFLAECGGLEEYLQRISSATLKKHHNGRTSWEAYEQIKQNLLPVQNTVEIGAMAEGIKTYINSIKEEIDEIKSAGHDEVEFLKTKLSSDAIVFLNDHGPEHMQKVIEKAFSIVVNMEQDLNEFEVLILLCAIQIHDIGNILGRIGHERKLNDIFDDKSHNIIIDKPEKRAIKSIAMVHGGKNSQGNKDTISALRPAESIFEHTIRTRLLAAILRLSDELADDLTRANRVAIDLDIIGVDSKIYHDYSRTLHTVNIKKDIANNDYYIELVYELDTEMLLKQYNVGGTQKFLLDEIYDRTLKMEQERRYCMKFMHQYINIDRIDVTINIYSSLCQFLNTITYKLEDISYPDRPKIGNIKEVDSSVPSGLEELDIIRAKGEII